jgi:hypothetical protein
MIPHQRPASDCLDAVLLHLRNTRAAHGDDPIGRAASREIRKAESATTKHWPERPA